MCGLALIAVDQQLVFELVRVRETPVGADTSAPLFPGLNIVKKRNDGLFPG